MATRPSYAYLRPDAGTRWGTSCPPWTSTTTTCQSSPRPPPSPPCLARAGLTQTWACGDSTVWINTMVCPPPFPFWVEAQRYEPTKINLTMLSHMWSEESARGVSNAVFWGQNRLNQLCSGVHLQIHHTHFSLLSSLLSMASSADAEQQLLCERCCHGSQELSAAHQHLAPHVLSHLRLTDIIQMTFQTLSL